MPKLIDRTGQRFGKWTVLRRAEAPPLDDTSIKRRSTYRPESKWSEKITWWLCRCDCGTERIVAASSLGKPVVGGSESCGCHRRQARLEPGRSAKNRVLKNYIGKCVERGLVFKLTFEEFDFLISSDCHYCGAAPNQQMEARYPPKPWWEPLLYNGIDRRDNNEGYTLANCLPCCWTCNRMKREMSYDNFLKYIREIHDRLEILYASTRDDSIPNG